MSCLNLTRLTVDGLILFSLAERSLNSFSFYFSGFFWCFSSFFCEESSHRRMTPRRSACSIYLFISGVMSILIFLIPPSYFFLPLFFILEMFEFKVTSWTFYWVTLIFFLELLFFLTSFLSVVLLLRFESKRWPKQDFWRGTSYLVASAEFYRPRTLSVLLFLETLWLESGLSMIL